MVIKEDDIWGFKKTSRCSLSYGHPKIEGGGTLESNTKTDEFQELFKTIAGTRISKKTINQHPKKTFHLPIAVVFIRGDCGGEALDLAESAINAFDYLNLHSDKIIDFIFPGWVPQVRKDNGITKLDFNIYRYVDAQNWFERQSSWNPTGEAELLLLNYSVSKSITSDEFDWSTVIILPIEEMVLRSKTTSLAKIFNELIASAKMHKGRNISKLSDHFFVNKGSKSLWVAFLNLCTLGASKNVNEISHYAIKNLKKK